MKGKLELAIINQEKPRLNYTVFYNGHLCKINEINIDEVTIKDYFTNEEFILDLDAPPERAAFVFSASPLASLR